MHPHGGISAIIDVAAGVAVLGSLVGYLPDVAAGMAIVWYVIQFYSWFFGRRVR